MNLVAPLWLGVAAIVAAGVVVAHLFSTSTPPEQPFPTARFVPQGTPMAVLRTTRLTDAGLLALRVLAVLLFGLALAGAHVPRSGPRRIVLVDASRAVDASTGVGTASADDADEPDGAEVVIVFDSVPRIVDAAVLDTLRPSTARGSLSAAIVAAHRAVGGVSDDREQIALTIVSPVVRDEVDSATIQLLRLWEGPVRLRRAAAAAVPPATAVEVRVQGDDPVAAALRLVPTVSGPVGVRLARGAITGADSAWARSGGVLVHWPLSAASGAFAWAVSSTRHTVVGLAKPETLPAAGTPIVRWSDGASAATESALGAGCVRSVAIPVDPVGDVALRASFIGLAEDLVAPCGGPRDFTQVPDSLILTAGRVREARLAPRASSTMALLLASLAMLALGVEQVLRRRGGRA